MRNQIWNSLNQSKFQGYVIGLYLERYQLFDRSINIILAIASSGSIASWIIWQEYSFIWAVIIASSQVISAVRPYLPYNKYVKELNSKCLKAANLDLEFERLWYRLQNNKITEDEAEEPYYDLRKKMIEIDNFNDETLMLSNKKIREKANERMKVFLKTHYNILVNITPKIKHKQNGREQKQARTEAN